MQLPNLDSISNQINKASGLLKGMSKKINQSLPEQNPSHHAGQLSGLKNTHVIALANALLKEIKPHINMSMQTVLDKMAKDPSINVAATGAFILASGGSPDAAVFLICKGILKNPGDYWAINDLGIYFRDRMQYEQSLQCYFYANNLDSGKSKVIDVNIGWASAYYGDFSTATEYFDKALAIDDNYSEALEGEALIAFQQGNIQKLYQCLAKEVKFMGGSAGAADTGPSDNFATFCAN